MVDPIDYGIARLAVIPVRQAPNHRAEQVTQLLFGERYKVLRYTHDKKWLYIRIFIDRYEGWIEYRQHNAITSAHFEHISRADYKITIDVASTILYKKNTLTLLMGSIIPLSTSELFSMGERFAFDGQAKSAGVKTDFDFLHKIALSYLNAPYMWGGKSPMGIDCSGFVQIVFRICGYLLPRDAAPQAEAGKEAQWKDKQAGDLVFFSDMGEQKISHVGILIDDSQVVHASGKVRVDRCTEEGLFDVDTDRQTHALVKLRRILM